LAFNFPITYMCQLISAIGNTATCNMTFFNLCIGALCVYGIMWLYITGVSTIEGVKGISDNFVFLCMCGKCQQGK